MYRYWRTERNYLQQRNQSITWIRRAQQTADSLKKTWYKFFTVTIEHGVTKR